MLEEKAAKTSVLIVDDVAAIRDLLRQMLHKLNFEDIDEASNAAYMLEKLENRSFDLIFLDIELPDDDGLNLLKKIRVQFPDSQVIMVSAHSTLSNVQQALEGGAMGFVVKPFNPKKIISVLNKCLK